MRRFLALVLVALSYGLGVGHAKAAYDLSGFRFSDGRLEDFRFRADADTVAFSCIDCEMSRLHIGWVAATEFTNPAAWQWLTLGSERLGAYPSGVVVTSRVDWAIGGGNLYVALVPGLQPAEPYLLHAPLDAAAEWKPLGVTGLPLFCNRVALAYAGGKIWLATSYDWLMQDMNWMNTNRWPPMPTVPRTGDGWVDPQLRLYSLDPGEAKAELRDLRYDGWKSCAEVQLCTLNDEPWLTFSLWSPMEPPWFLRNELWAAQPWAPNQGDKQWWVGSEFACEMEAQLDDMSISMSPTTTVIAAMSGLDGIRGFSYAVEPQRWIASTLWPSIVRSDLNEDLGTWVIEGIATMVQPDQVVLACGAYQAEAVDFFGHADAPSRIAVGSARLVDPRGAYQPAQTWTDITQTANDQYALSTYQEQFVLVHQTSTNPDRVRLLYFDATTTTAEAELTLPGS